MRLLKRHDLFLASLLVIVALLVRIPVALERKIMPAGDAFNFHHITNHIQHFSYPIREKRLPFYSLLLLPGRLAGVDPISVSVTVSLIAGTGSLGVLYALGRILGVHPVPLIAFGGLAAFDPLLTVNSVRPLADSTFIVLTLLMLLSVCRLLILKLPQPLHTLLVTGVISTALMFTRYEGILLAMLTLPLVLRLGWRTAATVAILPLVAGLLWIPAHRSIHGSLGGLSYVTDASGSGFGEIATIPANISRMMEGAGWRRVWDIPSTENMTPPEKKAAYRILASPSWWLGVFALLGVAALPIRAGYAALPVLASIAGYSLLLAWWWVYSRYVAPLSAFFYLSAAAGASLLITAGLHHTRTRIQRFAGGGVAVLVATVCTWILINESGPLFSRALSAAWEGNYRGYALLTALQESAAANMPTAYYTAEHAFATLYLGHLAEPPSRTNPALGFYLSDYAEADAATLAEKIQQQRVRRLIVSGTDPRLLDLVRILTTQKHVAEKRTLRSVNVQDGTVEEVPILMLTW